MALEQKVIDLIAEAIKSAQTVYFDPQTNSICILQLSRLGLSLHAQPLSYTGCTRTNIESALECSGMSHVGYEGEDGIVVFQIKKPPTEAPEQSFPNMTPKEILSTLPWFMIIVDKKAGEATFYYSESNKPFSTASQITIKCGLATLEQAIKECGQDAMKEDASLSRQLLVLRRNYLPVNAQTT